MPMLPARALARELVCAPALRCALAALATAAGIAGAAGGCGSSGSGAGSVAAAPGAIATPPLTTDDAPVARVNGRTVWASCVATQAQAIAAGGDRERRAAALDQCIAFELLAQAAEARGLAAAPEVVQAARSAEVNRVVEAEFEQRYRRPADLAPQIDAVLNARPWLLRIPELRDSSYARFVVPKGAPEAVETQAHALADRLAAALADQTGMFGVHLADAARRIAQGSGAELDARDFRPAPRDQLDAAYGTALFAIPAIGRASQAVRTPWGWDVVVWTGGSPARERSRAEVAAELFPELRRRQFQRWVSQLARQRGIAIQIEQGELTRLDAEGGS
ncbi:MAG TPA: hypothetical protein VHT91_17770 [Kofleriaceae bacterium]|jgi:hypothetical protein|nr:hypothetical protein [Kofleriaceae bacterium]